MSTTSYKRTTCRACLSTSVDLALALTPTPIGDAYVTPDALNVPQEYYPLELYLCRECGLAQLLHVINPEDLYRHFTYTTSVSLGLVEHFRDAACNLLERYQLKKGSRIVDLGSNDGSFLKVFKEKEMAIVGVDPAKEIAERASAAGVPTLPEFFDPRLAERIKSTYGTADLITANNTMANVDDLGQFAQGVRALLAPGGVFAIETGYAADLLAHELFDTLYHEHLSYFSVRSLGRYFQRNGLELIYAERIGTKGGSLRAVAQLKGGPRPVDASVARMISDEDARGTNDLKMYECFGAHLARIRDELHNLLASLKKQGKSISGYGASVGSTTFLFHFGMHALLESIFDDNPVKFGKYTPGIHVPVYSSDEIYSRKPDYVAIISWRYCDPIIKRHPKFLQAGGKFVVTFPEIRVV